jgi:hypothetical protein
MLITALKELLGELTSNGAFRFSLEHEKMNTIKIEKINF